jgi:hypothetical protein
MKQSDSDFLEARMDAIARGVKEAIRREVRRLHEQGLPVYIEKDGVIITAPPPASLKPPEKS